MREGCEVHRGDLRELDEARKAMRGCTHVIHLAAIVGGIANFHKLPHTLTEVNNALYNAVFRAALDDGRRALHVRELEHGLRARDAVPDARGLPAGAARCRRSAYGFSKLTGEVYCRAAHAEHGLPFTICRPFNAYGPGEMPDDEPGIAHAVPDLIRKSLRGCSPLPIFGTGEQTRTLTHVDDIADGDRGRHGRPGGAQRGLQHLGQRRADRRRDRAHLLGGLRQRPRGARFEHLPSFEVDVVRRWPSVEKAERLLGWQARIGVEEGIAQTVAWLREQEEATA